MDEDNYYFFSKKTKYTKRFHKNSSDYNEDLLNNQVNKCTRLIIKEKEENEC